MPKTVRRLGSITTLRGATPTSPEVAKHFMNFRFNHLTQRNTMPSVLGRGNTTGVSWGPCNSGGTDQTSAQARTGQAWGDGGMVAPRNDPGATEVE